MLWLPGFAQQAGSFALLLVQFVLIVILSAVLFSIGAIGVLGSAGLRVPEDVAIIGFARGAGTGLVRYATATGIDAIGLDAGVAPSWAAEHLPQTLCLQGNLDPLLIAVDGSAMDVAAQAILSAWRRRAFVFNLGHGITPDVPIANVDRLSAILHAWRREQSA